MTIDIDIYQVDAEVFMLLPEESLEQIVNHYINDRAALQHLSSMPRIRNIAMPTLWEFHAEVTLENLNDTYCFASIIQNLTIKDERVLDHLGHIRFPDLKRLRLVGVSRFPSVMNLSQSIQTLELDGCDHIQFDAPKIAETKWLVERVFTKKLWSIRINFVRSISIEEIHFIYTYSPTALQIFGGSNDML